MPAISAGGQSPTLYPAETIASVDDSAHGCDHAQAANWRRFSCLKQSGNRLVCRRHKSQSRAG